MADRLTTPLLSKKSDEFELSDFKVKAKAPPSKIPATQPQAIQSPSIGPTPTPRQPPINTQIPAVQGGLQAIKCAGCQTTLGYLAGAYCVKCPHCSTLTAVQEVAQLGCPYCRQVIIFPRTAPYVKCQCGCVFRNQFSNLV